jgi:hypothetical protein
MAISVSLVNFTDQGIRNIKDSPQRARAFREICKQNGVQVREMLWTTGTYDMVVIIEGPEDALSSVLLSAAKPRQRAYPVTARDGPGDLPARGGKSALGFFPKPRDSASQAPSGSARCRIPAWRSTHAAKVLLFGPGQYQYL